MSLLESAPERTSVVQRLQRRAIDVTYSVAAARNLPKQVHVMIWDKETDTLVVTSSINYSSTRLGFKNIGLNIDPIRIQHSNQSIEETVEVLGRINPMPIISDAASIGKFSAGSLTQKSEGHYEFQGKLEKPLEIYVPEEEIPYHKLFAA